MNIILKKEDKPYMFALFIVFLVYVSFEIFAFGFNLGKEKAHFNTVSLKK